MLGIEHYGSDNDSDNENDQSGPSKVTVKPKALPLKKTTFNLPSPKTSSNGSRLSLPPAKSKKGPKKIAITLSNLERDEQGESDDDERPAKKPRLQSGAGASSLLSMLPAPKQKVATLPPPQRVLGGGNGPGLVFNTSRPIRPSDGIANTDSSDLEFSTPLDEQPTVSESSSKPAMLFRPTSVGKGRANVSVEETRAPARSTVPQASSGPAVDFFSIGLSPSTSTSAQAAPPKSASSSSYNKPASFTLSSAPEVEEFKPPEPTPNDEYPGYYQLPSGAWAAYDSKYYQTCYKKWETDYNSHVRALEKGMVKGFEDLETAGAQEVDALKEMERAKVEIQEREKRKAVTHGAEGAPVAPKMKITAAKQSGVARSRHQLSTLLMEAYQNREALEDRIAEGRRNRKEAGNKYGF